MDKLIKIKRSSVIVRIADYQLLSPARSVGELMLGWSRLIIDAIFLVMTITLLYLSSKLLVVETLSRDSSMHAEVSTLYALPYQLGILLACSVFMFACHKAVAFVGRLVSMLLPKVEID